MRSFMVWCVLPTNNFLVKKIILFKILQHPRNQRIIILDYKALIACVHDCYYTKQYNISITVYAGMYTSTLN